MKFRVEINFPFAEQGLFADNACNSQRSCILLAGEEFRFTLRLMIVLVQVMGVICFTVQCLMTVRADIRCRRFTMG